MTLKKKKLFGGTIQFPCPRFCSVLLGCHPIQDAFKVLKSLTQAGPQFPTVSKLSKVDQKGSCQNDVFTFTKNIILFIHQELLGV